MDSNNNRWTSANKQEAMEIKMIVKMSVAQRARFPGRQMGDKSS